MAGSLGHCLDNLVFLFSKIVYLYLEEVCITLEETPDLLRLKSGLGRFTVLTCICFKLTGICNCTCLHVRLSACLSKHGSGPDWDLLSFLFTCLKFDNFFFILLENTFNWTQFWLGFDPLESCSWIYHRFDNGGLNYEIENKMEI